MLYCRETLKNCIAVQFKSSKVNGQAADKESMAYSVDFREAAIEYWQAGHNEKELYEAFKIYPSRIYEWLRHKKKQDH
jgi:hypothetical protein